MINDTQVSLDADQAQQLLQQLAVCLDTLTHNHPARAALGSTLIITTMEPADVERFLADLAHTYRYLDARLATARRTRKEAANQNRVGPHQTSTVGPNGLVILIETVFADLIDGPLAHLPSSQFGANGAWTLCAAISHNLLRAAGTMAGPAQAVARGATLRRTIVTVPARIAQPQRRPVLHLPAHWPWATAWLTLWDRILGQGLPPPVAA